MKLIIHPAKNLSGPMTPPGDKSISHRTLIMGAMAHGKTEARNWLDAGVTKRMVDCLRRLGTQIELIQTGSPGQATLLVEGQGEKGFTPPTKPLYCGGSATTMRLLMGLLATQPFTATLDGHAGLRRRPMERVAKPLRLMGAKIQTSEGHAPITLTGGNLKGTEYDMPVASAQLQTALLIAATGVQGTLILHQPGPARDHTLRMLSGMGADITEENGVITFNPEKFIPQPLNFTVPGDISSAAFMMTAALLVPDSHLEIQDVNTNHTRTGLLETYQAMGGQIEITNKRTEAGEPIADIQVETSSLQATEIKGEIVVRMIDEFPIFTVAALKAHGRTIVRDAIELRTKESDRIKTVVEEFTKLGATILPHPDGFEIVGPQYLKGATVNSHHDHRLTMSLAIAGLVAEGETIIEEAEELNESFPGFVETLQELGADIEWVA